MRNNFRGMKMVKELGHSPYRIRRAITAMKRRGVPHKRAVQSVLTVNAAHAGQAMDLLRGECLCANVIDRLVSGEQAQ